MPKTIIPITACGDRRLPDVNGGEFVQLSDEELCKNARRGCTASKDLLWQRYGGYIQKIVQLENRRHHLPQHEMFDALQDLYFAFHTSILRYNPQNYRRGKPASFKTFLHLVIAHRFSNYCALWRIYHKRLKLKDNNTVCEVLVNTPETNGCSSWHEEGIFLYELFPDRLAGALEKLKPKEKHLLEVWLQYGRDKQVAQVLGISPAAAKLRRERLFHRIRQSMIQK
jgi:DNA-directed RNA polymerase specialized sigma24 family protein